MLTVSIVMPVYNVERHVGRSLAALLALRIPDRVAVSLIVVDDHCTDASMDVVGALLRDAPFPVQVLRHPVNLGRAVARNTGLAAATGEFVWFVDSDDWVAPGLLAALAGAVTPEVDVVVADVVPVREDGGRGRRVVRPGAGALWRGPQAVEEYLFQRIPAQLVNQLIRTELFDGVEFPAGRLHDDVAVCARLLRRARAVAYVPGPAYYHLQRGGFSARILDLYTGVLDACALLSTEPDHPSAAGLLHFRLRAGAMAVIDAAARSRGEAGASVVAIVRRDLRFADVLAAARQQLWPVAIRVLLVLLAPGFYTRFAIGVLRARATPRR